MKLPTIFHNIALLLLMIQSIQGKEVIPLSSSKREIEHNVVAWLGDGFPIEAEIEEPIANCQWIHKSTVYKISTTGDPRLAVGVVNGKKCVKYFHNVSQWEIGEWMWIVRGISGKQFNGSYLLTVLNSPNVSLTPAKIVAEADAENVMTCMVMDTAQICPLIQWEINSRPITTNISNRICSDKSFAETIRYVFHASDHEGNLTCQIEGVFTNHGQTALSNSVQLKVYSINFNGKITVQKLEDDRMLVSVIFIATPKPNNVYWLLKDGTKLRVEPLIHQRQHSNHQAYGIQELKTLNKTAFEASLTVEFGSVIPLSLVVTSDFGTEHLYNIPQDLSSSKTVSNYLNTIIILVLALFFVVIISLWCKCRSYFSHSAAVRRQPVEHVALQSFSSFNGTSE